MNNVICPQCGTFIIINGRKQKPMNLEKELRLKGFFSVGKKTGKKKYAINKRRKLNAYNNDSK